jgi:hypothetical protein
MSAWLRNDPTAATARKQIDRHSVMAATIRCRVMGGMAQVPVFLNL